MSSNYITPYLTYYKSLDTFLNADKKEISIDWSTKRNRNRGKPFEWEDLLSTKRAFIIGEPGCGKSTSLKEIVIQASAKGKQGIIFPINQIPAKASIEDYFEKVPLLKELEGKNLFDEPAFKTNNFKWEDSENIIICLDALDEVNANDFNGVIQKIKSFSNNYSNVFILISCRDHYIRRSKSKFSQFENYAFIKVQNFTEYQIKEFLEGKYLGSNKDGIINSIIQKSKNNINYSVLAIPRYLEVLAAILQDSDKTPEDILKMKRVDFFEQFIYKKLEAEVKKENERKKEENEVILANEVVITKRVLEKLALVMEIYQTNQITKEELVTFLDDTNSNANLLFLNQIDLDTFINRVLKHLGDCIEFDNTEFQEYLAAKEVLRMGQRSQILFDLIIEPNLKHIYKNWYDVLRYVIELDASLVIPIVGLLKQKGENLVADDFFTLVKTVDNEKLDSKDKTQIFDTIFEYSQKSYSYLDMIQARRFAEFYQPDNYKHYAVANTVTSSYNERFFINQVHIIDHLLRTDKLTAVQKQYWKEQLKAGAQNQGFTLSQQNCLYALGNIEDLSVFEEMVSIFNCGDKELDDAFIFSCSKVNANCQFTMDIIIKNIKAGNGNTSSDFNNVTETKWLTYILTKLLEDEELLKLYVEGRNHHPYSDDYYVLLQNIEKSWNEVLQSKSKDLLNTLIHNSEIERHYSEGIIEQIILLLSRKEEDFVFELLPIIPGYFNYYSLERTFCQIIKVKHIDRLIDEANKSQPVLDIVEQVLLHIKSTPENPEKEEIYEAGRNYFPEKYIRWEALAKFNEENRGSSIYYQFTKELEPTPDKINFNVFSTFYKNIDIIRPMATVTQIERLQLMLRNAFRNNDIENGFTYQIKKEGNNFSSSQSNYFIADYGFYLRVALELDLGDELKEYRRYFVQYLPFASQDDVEYILDYLGELNENDIQNLLRITTNRTDNYLEHFPYSLIRIIGVLKRTEFIPLLKAFINSTQTQDYIRKEAIECLCNNFTDSDQLLNVCFQELFEKFISDKNDELADAINHCLIAKFRDATAIQWRFEEIKRKAFPFVRVYSDVVRYIPDWEDELDSPTFLNSVINLSDASLIPQFQDILIFSFELRKKNDFIEYSDYLQRNVYQYYLTLKNIASYKYLKELKGFIAASSYKEESKSFKYHLRNLEIAYIEKIGAPNNIADSIKKYNELKLKRYQPIITSLELFHVIQEVIDEDISGFIQKEGFYRPMEYLAGIPTRKAKALSKKSVPFINEDTIQKTIKIQIENGLLKRGFRESDIHREVQLYNNNRLDLLVSYGFVGPIMLELKLLHNNEIINKTERNKYKEKIKQYLEGSHSQYGLYLIFKVKDVITYDKYLDYLKEEYQDIENLEIKSIDCFVNY